MIFVRKVVATEAVPRSVPGVPGQARHEEDAGFNRFLDCARNDKMDARNDTLGGRNDTLDARNEKLWVWNDRMGVMNKNERDLQLC